VPSFINEITPTELKGPYGAITQLLITFGIFIANVLGTPLPDSKTPIDKSFIQTEYWRVLFGLPIVFCIIQSCLLFTVFNYETPKFLKQTGREAELNEIIGKIYSSDQIESRIDAIPVSVGGAALTYKETLFSPKYRIATLMGCALAVG